MVERRNIVGSRRRVEFNDSSRVLVGCAVWGLHKGPRASACVKRETTEAKTGEYGTVFTVVFGMHNLKTVAGNWVYWYLKGEAGR